MASSRFHPDSPVSHNTGLYKCAIHFSL